MTPQNQKMSAMEDRGTMSDAEIKASDNIVRWGNSSAVLVRAVVMDKRRYIDARKLLQTGDDKWHPTRKGLMVSQEIWQEIIPIIKKIIENAEIGHDKI